MPRSAVFSTDIAQTHTHIEESDNRRITENKYTTTSQKFHIRMKYIGRRSKKAKNFGQTTREREQIKFRPTPKGAEKKSFAFCGRDRKQKSSIILKANGLPHRFYELQKKEIITELWLGSNLCTSCRPAVANNFDGHINIYV